MKDITKKYSNGEITVVWKPNTCIHSGICFSGLPAVFDPKRRPWVTMEGTSSQDITNQVDRCPSGALSYYRNDAGQPNEINAESIVEVSQNGPLLVYGNLTIKTKNGEEQRKNKVTAFCRCGASSNKPYCDGTHQKINFRG